MGMTLVSEGQPCVEQYPVMTSMCPTDLICPV